MRRQLPGHGSSIKRCSHPLGSLWYDGDDFVQQGGVVWPQAMPPLSNHAAKMLIQICTLQTVRRASTWPAGGQEMH